MLDDGADDDIFGDEDLMLAAAVDLELDDDFDEAIAASDERPARAVDQRVNDAIVALSDDDDDDADLLAAAAVTEATIVGSTTARHQPIAQRSVVTSQDYEDAANNEADDEAFARAAFEQQLELESENADVFEPTPPQPAPRRREEPPPQKPPTTPNVHAPTYPFRIQGCNLVTLRQLQQHISGDPQSRPQQFAQQQQLIVRAEVASVFEKLQVKADGWRIGVLLRDHQGTELRCRLGDAVLDALTGTSAVELHQMRRQARDRPQTLETITEILGALKQQLEELRCFFKMPPALGSAEEDAAGWDGVPMVASMVRSMPVLERIFEAKRAAEEQ